MVFIGSCCAEACEDRSVNVMCSVPVSRITCASYNSIAGKLCAVSEDYLVLEDLQIGRERETVVTGCEMSGYRGELRSL